MLVLLIAKSRQMHFVVADSFLAECFFGCVTATGALQSASVYTAAGTSDATTVYAGNTTGSITTTATTPTSTVAASTSSSTAATAQTNVENGGGGPDYAGAYAHNFTASVATATPTTGTTSTAGTTTVAASSVIALDTVLNSKVVGGNMTSVNTTATRVIAVGTGSFEEVQTCSLSHHSWQVWYVLHRCKPALMKTVEDSAIGLFNSSLVCCTWSICMA